MQAVPSCGSWRAGCMKAPQVQQHTAPALLPSAAAQRFLTGRLHVREVESHECW